MLIAMSMDAGVVVKSQEEEDYGLEVMHGNWNPVLAGLQEAAAEMAGQLIKQQAMPACMAEIDVDAFLMQMYAAQR